jgi:UDP-N-acetylmuramyl pentapeptide synthase
VKRGLPAPVTAAGGRILRSLALAYRAALLGRVTFIAVTGSTGKTTTKDLIHAILASRLHGRKNAGNENVSIHRTVLRTSPWHAYCVQEIGVGALGGRRFPIERALALVRPRIGVVTNIGTDHLSTFGSIEGIAAEKGKLVEALPASGTAILNADDPLVRAMTSRCRGKIVTYGLAPEAMIRAEGVRSQWPDRLSFDVLHDGQRHAVRTQLCGAHWVPCVLAAIAAALEMGVPPAVAARTLETVPPPEGRMQPVTRADGVTFVRDDFKAPLPSIAPALNFMRNARASRKIVVIGTISDYTGGSSRRYRQVARWALDAADLVLFVGPKAPKCLGARTHPKGEALRAFISV